MVYTLLTMDYDELTEKKKRLDAFRPLPDSLVHNLKEMGGGRAGRAESDTLHKP